LFFLHKGGETIESAGPEALVAVQPVHRLLHWLCCQPARDRAAGLLARDQASIRQDIEMLHDRGQRHRKRPRQLAHRKLLAAFQPRQQRAPRRVRERGEGAVQGLIVILNHTV